MKTNRACIFAHFDKDDIIDEYVVYYIKELEKVSNEIIFVSTSNISQICINKISSSKTKVFKRENIGYDFYSYKSGIEKLDLSKYDELIICNDSVFGPISPLEEVFSNMHKQKCDFWGITASKSIDYHLQSYFIVFGRSILRSDVFLEFWDNVGILDNKDDIVKQYEVGLSQILLKKEFTFKSYIDNIPYTIGQKDNMVKLLKRLIKSPYKIMKFFVSPQQYWKAIKQKNTNTSLVYWDTLLLQHKMPFLKKSLFTNHQDATKNLNKLENFRENIPPYPICFIKNYLKRTM